MPRPQHRAPLVDSVVHDEEIVVLGEEVFRLQMHLSLLRRRAHFIAILDEATILVMIK